MSKPTVGEVRTALCQWSGVPHVDTAHYVIIIHDEASGAAAILSCCEDQRDIMELLQRGLAEMAGRN